MPSESNLWQFALKTYQRPGVAELLLRWQDEQQVSINLVLWLLWLERRGQVISGHLLQQAQQRITTWHQQNTQPLRQMRRQLKAGGLNDLALAGFYKQLKAAELAAEKVELQWLANLVPEAVGPALALGSNIRDYLLGQGVDAAQQHALLALVR